MRKRIISAILVVLLLLSFSIIGYAADEKVPAGAAGEKTDKIDMFSKDNLERIIRTVKSKITVPEEFDQFTSGVDSYSGVNVCRLHWGTQYPYSMGNGGSIDVTVDTLGVITSYNYYTYSRDYDYQRKLPHITKDAARLAAERFLGYVAPEINGLLDLNPENVQSYMEYEGSFRFVFTRTYKGVPFEGNNATILVNGQSGKVTSYNLTWRNDVVFPETKGIIEKAAAEKAMQDALGLELKYKRTYGKGKDYTYLEYSPKENGSFSIDALTGKKVTVNNYNSLYYDQLYRMEAYRREAGMYSKELNLNTEQLEELKLLEGLVSVQDAEKAARGMKELGLDANSKLSSYSYGEDSNTNLYTLRLDFVTALTKEATGKDIPEEKLKIMMAAGEGGRTVTVSFDAKTLNLVSVNAYGFNGSGEKTNLDRNAMQKIAEGFVKTHKADIYRQLELLPQTTVNDPYSMKYYGTDPGNPNSFIFMRKVNNITFEDNKVIVSVDPQSGNINSYNELWDNMEFVSTDGVISLDNAYKALLAKNSLKLKYVIAQSAADSKGMPYDPMLQNGEIKLVYALDYQKPLNIDARKGILINQLNGEPYIDTGAMSFKDLEGEPSKEIVTQLASIGILMYEENFRPDQTMVQKDYLYIMAKLRGSYYLSAGQGTPSQKEMDGMYRALLSDGIIYNDEEEPDRDMTTIEAVRYLVRVAGYGRFAEMKGIFSCDYADAEKIPAADKGYAAVAKALNIVKGQSFNPDKVLTRAEAVTLIYNFLMR